ncbi:MAG: AEC family transporter [Oscillospiraceae bacterium]|nr:AEC family transporter [Oscillospiraceae bacterium]
MLTAFMTVFEQMFRILLLIGGGFLLRRLRLLPEGAEKVMSRLVTYLFLPAVLLHTNLLECRILTLGENLPLALCGLIMALVSIGAAVLIAPCFARGDLYERGLFRYAIAYPNTGGVGMPLILAMLGTKGLFQYNLFYFFALIFNYSWGIMQLQPVEKRRGGADMLRRLANPALIGLVLGMVLGVLGAGEWIPGIVLDTVGDLSDCYVPVSLLLVGYTVAGFPLGNVFRDARAYTYSALRLLVLPVLTLVVLRLIGAPHIMSVMTALAFACPCGMNTVLYPVSYGQDCQVGVSMVLVSSLLAVVTMPVVYALTAL